jgi:hypothetical protein
MRLSPLRLGILIVSASMLVGTPAWAAPGGEAVKRAGSRPVAASRQSNDAQNRDVRVHNQTGWTMTRLYVSSGGGWTGDLLGAGGLAPGRSARVSIDDGSGACRYSLRAEFDNGETLQRGGINSCQIADYYFTR